MAWPRTEGAPDELVHNSLPNVDHVDMFISHSWDCPSWMKCLALCQFLNFDMAANSAFLVWLSTALILLIHAGGVAELAASMAGTNFLTYALVYFPMAVFCVVYFFGHKLCRKTFWFDRICVNQADLDLKAKALDALPYFVANSNEMLILLDEHYLEPRLAAFKFLCVCLFPTCQVRVARIYQYCPSLRCLLILRLLLRLLILVNRKG